MFVLPSRKPWVKEVNTNVRFVTHQTTGKMSALKGVLIKIRIIEGAIMQIEVLVVVSLEVELVVMKWQATL